MRVIKLNFQRKSPIWCVIRTYLDVNLLAFGVFDIENPPSASHVFVINLLLQGAHPRPTCPSPTTYE